jgi:hypothetical protein
MAYMSASEREKEIQDRRAHLDDTLKLFNQSAPRPFTDEAPDQYDKRTLSMVQRYASPELREVKVDDLYGTAFTLVKKQIFDSAAREADRPTMVPEGELKQITRYDESGRKSYEFFGSPRAWMNNFAAPRKQLVGIMSPGVRYVEVK